MAHARKIGLSVAWLLLLPGCLANSYEIPRDELQRLVEVPPENRGQVVHAVQRFSTATEPPRAPSWAPRPEDLPQDGGSGYGDNVYAPYQGDSRVGYFYVMPPVYLAFGPPTYYARSPGYGEHVGGAGGGGFYSGGGASSGFSRGDSKSQAAALVAVAVAAAAVFTVGLAASEGARYDGIIALHPHHPVHLLAANGADRLVGLDDLTAQDLDPRNTAVVVADEGAGLWRRGRLPLDRRGATWQFGGGWMLQQVALDRALSGYVFHMNLGGFLTRSFGIVGTVDAGAASDWHTPGDMWFLRYGAELVWLPIHLGPWHFGPRFGGGWQYINTGGGDWPYLSATHPYITAGVESEIEMTTRLAFSIRAGGMWQPDSPWSGAFTPAVQLGLNVY
jgi:hypothetical protein